MRKVIIAWLIFLVHPGWTSEIGVKADPSTFQEIFDANLKTSKTNIMEGRKRYDLELSIASAQLQNTVLSNSYYDVNYADQVPSHLVANFYSGMIIPLSPGLSINPQIGFAYSFQESIVEARAKRGGMYKDVLRVQWAPIFVGSKIMYSFVSLPISLLGKFGATYDWISVSGDLDGINQTFWTPTYNARIGVGLFEDRMKDIDSWFGGLTLYYGLTRGLSGDNRAFANNAFELSVRFFL